MSDMNIDRKFIRHHQGFLPALKQEFHHTWRHQQVLHVLVICIYQIMDEIYCHVISDRTKKNTTGTPNPSETMYRFLKISRSIKIYGVVGNLCSLMVLIPSFPLFISPKKYPYLHFAIFLNFLSNLHTLQVMNFTKNDNMEREIAQDYEAYVEYHLLSHPTFNKPNQTTSIINS